MCDGPGGRSIAAVRAHALPWGGQSRFDALHLVLSDDQEVSLVVKDYGCPRPARDRFEHRYARERSVYVGLLAGAGLDTPRYYGSVCRPERGRYWLILEYVLGERLRWRHNGRFEEAAAWLGRMQAHFRLHPERLRPEVPLIQHDADFFASWQTRALGTTAAISSSLAQRLERTLPHHQAAIAHMTSQPPSLVHGALHRRHIVIGACGDGMRVSPLDWGRAALGSPLYDLALLSEIGRAS